MIILIDNYDSFTYNLYQLIESLGFQVKVYSNDKIDPDGIAKLSPERIVISPGPKTPLEAGVSCDIIRRFYKSIPILGVCLGHQCIGSVFGSTIIPAKHMIHGRATPIFHNNHELFKGISSPFSGARYHSLVIDQVPDQFEQIAWDDNDDIMGIAHRTLPVFGVQFHPESFMTRHGAQLLINFLNA